MKAQRRIRQLHKVLSAIVVIQLFLWMLSGLYMTAVPIDKVRGQHLISAQTSEVLSAQTWMPLSTVIERYAQVERIEVFSRFGQPAYRVHAAGKKLLLSAITGNTLSPIEKEQAIELAKKRYQGDGVFKAAQLITKQAQAPEVRGRQMPVWQVSFDDWLNTHIYVSANDADIVAVRSDLWRWFDFLWMLHIMDYDEREDFNNPLVILMASLGLLLVTSGVLMLLNGVNKKGLRSLWN